MNPAFEAIIKNGEPFIPKQSRFKAWIKHKFKEGQKVLIVVKKFSKKRTNQQNAYYWAVVVDILANHFGYEPEEMHEELKQMFNPIDSKIRPGKKIGGSTTKIPRDKFIDDYCERICRWAATEYQIVIPPPQGFG